MECPYCHAAMEPGTMCSLRDPVFWFPKGKRPRFLFPLKKQLENMGGLRFNTPYLSQKDAVNSWYCRMCRRIIVMNVP